MTDERALAIKASITAAIATGTQLWGITGWVIIAWLGCMLLDWVTGSLAAASRKEWKSSTARNGIWHKAGMIVVVIVSAITDLALGFIVNNISYVKLPFNYTTPLLTIVLVWYIFTELGSILENAVLMGAPCPNFLKNILKITESKISDIGNKLLDEDEKNIG